MIYKNVYNLAHAKHCESFEECLIYIYIYIHINLYIYIYIQIYICPNSALAGRLRGALEFREVFLEFREAVKNLGEFPILLRSVPGISGSCPEFREVS